MNYTEYDKEISDKEREFTRKLVALCGYGLENHKDFESLVKNDFSSDFSAMKLIEKLFNEVYERAESDQKASLDSFDINKLKEQICVFECLNQLEKKHKIKDASSEIEIDHEMSFEEYVEFINLTCSKYDEHINKLFEIAEINAGLNVELNKFLRENNCINEETEMFEFNFIFEDQEDYQCVKEYFQKREDINNFIDNITEAVEFVLGGSQMEKC